MIPFRYLPACLAVLLVCLSTSASAGVYKCVAADGSLTYSQTPCPNQVSTAVSTSSGSAADRSAECRYASRFAGSVATDMRRGRASADVFDRYGGLDGLSKSAINIISYVYQYQHSDNLSTDRIATLAGGKCKAHAFGEVSCETMPYAWIDDIGGCDEDEDDEASAAQPEPTRDESEPAIAQTMAPTATRPAAATSNDDDGAAWRDACRDRLRDQIDSINAQMRNGYSSQQGERYRDRLRVLRQQINDC